MELQKGEYYVAYPHAYIELCKNIDDPAKRKKKFESLVEAYLRINEPSYLFVKFYKGRLICKINPSLTPAKILENHNNRKKPKKKK
jgi:hypothetical protein